VAETGDADDDRGEHQRDHRELDEADEDLADPRQCGCEPGHLGLLGDEAEQCAEHESREHGEPELVGFCPSRYLD
jgi:hypothetical protein